MSHRKSSNGKFPASWPICRLDEVARIRSGVTLGRQLSGTGIVELPYLRVANVQDGHLDLSEIKKVEVRRGEIQRYLLQPGDILMTEGGDFDKLGRGTLWTGEISPCLHQNHIFRVRADRTRVVPGFLARVIESETAKRYFLRCAKRTTNLASINKTQLRAFRFPLPPLEEQVAIAQILDAVDNCVDQTHAAIGKADCLRRGIMQRAFNSIDAERTKLGATITDIRYGTSQASNTRRRGYPTLRIPNIVRGTIDLRHVTCVDANDGDAKRFGLEDRDLLLVRTNGNPHYVGRSAVFRKADNQTWLYASYLIRIRLADDLEPRFVDEYLKTERGRRELLRRVTTSAGNHNINTNSIRALPIRIPSDTLRQREVVRLADAAIKNINSLHSRLSSLEKLKMGLMHDLLSGEFRVGRLSDEAIADRIAVPSEMAT